MSQPGQNGGFPEGGEPPSIEQILGYDPFTFFQLANPTGYLSYIIFGWAHYESLQCILLLFSVRDKWKKPIYIALATSLFLQTVSTICGSIGYSVLPAVATDLFAGDLEYYWITTNMAWPLLARWAYFVATIWLILNVLPEQKTVKNVIFVMTSLALAGTIWYYVSIVRLYAWQHESYLLYLETHDLGLVLGARVYDFLAIIPDVQNSLFFETITNIGFMVLTKIPFLVLIFQKLEVPLKEALRTMATTPSTARIFISCLWCIIEGTLAMTIEPGALTLAVSMYVMTFQIHTFSLLAFEGSAAIVKMHSMAYSATGLKVPTSSAGGGSVPSKGAQSAGAIQNSAKVGQP